MLPKSSIPQSLLDKCDQLQVATVRLDASIPAETAKPLGVLLRATNSFYSNLIEGQYTEPLELAATAPKRDRKQLTELAVGHVHAQMLAERFLGIQRVGGGANWAWLFSPVFVGTMHNLLFRYAKPSDLRLQDGTSMSPGAFRGRDVTIGEHIPPSHAAVLEMLHRMQQVYGTEVDFRYRLLGAMAYHHRLSWVHPFPDGNGRTMRLITHLHLTWLDLASDLWSLSRGLARRQSEYYVRLANADSERRGALDGRGTLSQKGLFDFVDFMLDTCLDQVEYMARSLATHDLRSRLEAIILTNEHFRRAKIRAESGRALHLLITQGRVSRSDFKVYLGVGDRLATEQLAQLISLGVVNSPTPRAREIYPAFPGWFAQQVFQDLHRRFD